MHRLVLGGLKFTYLANHHAVGIITHSGRKFVFPLKKVQSNPKFRSQNGTSDGRISSNEVAEFIIKNRLLR